MIIIAKVVILLMLVLKSIDLSVFFVVILPMSTLSYASCCLMLAESKSGREIKVVKFYLVLASDSNAVALIIVMYQLVTRFFFVKGSQEEIG